MKIAMVAPEVFPVPPIHGGAVETVIDEASKHLTNHDVHIFSIGDPTLAAVETRGYRTYHRWKRHWLDRVLLSSWKLPFKQSRSPWYYWPYSRWVAAHVKREKPEVIWVHSRAQFVPWLRRAAPEATIVLSLHQLSSLEGSRVWEAAIRACDCITGVSRFVVDELVARYPAARAKAQTLYNGVNRAQIRPRGERLAIRRAVREGLTLGDGPVVLYAGRLVEQKGVHVLAEAFLHVASRVPAAQLIIAGGHTYSDQRETPYITRLKDRLSPLGDAVRWLGYVSAERVPQLYAAADLVVVPSVGPEGFPMVILEAMAAGLPVIAFAHGGPRELIQDDETGRLVDVAAGAEGLAEAMTTLLADPTRSEALGQRARAIVEARFTWHAIVEEFLRLVDAPVRVLIAESGSGYGGSAKYLSELLTQLDHRRYDVHVAAAEAGPFIARIKEQGVPVSLRPSWKFPWLEATRLGGAMQLLVIVPTIARWLKQQRIQLVHLNNEILSHLPLLLAAQLAGCRVICHLHGWRPLTRIERWAVRWVDELVCVSEAGATFYREQLRGRPVTAIPNGIGLNGQTADLDTKRLRQRRQLGVSEEDIVVAVVGRLVPWKGHEVFLKAFARAVHTTPRLVGLIVGHDPAPGQAYLTRLRVLAQALGIAARVRFVAWQDDVWSVYAAADIVVHASTKPEPFGLVILEAMAAGKPVIATHAGGVVDLVVDGETGRLVEPGDVAGLAQTISETVEHHPRTQQCSAQGRQRVRTRFTIERNAEQVSRVYDRLLHAVAGDA